MKTKTKKLVNAMIGLSVTAVVFVTSCKKENTVEPIANNTPVGTAVIDARIGGYAPATYNSPGAWKVDKSHSNIQWETKYYGNNAPLTGRFNWFDYIVYFDEANPANTSIVAKVQLSSMNTGEPGRDGYQKCGPTALGVQWDTTAKKAVAATDTASFTSTGCVRHGDGYLLKGNFKFRGVTIPVEMPMTFTKISTVTNATTGKKTDRAGLSAHLGINALSVFKVSNTSISDLVTIHVNCNMVTNPY